MELKPNLHPCCEWFEEAKKWETDNEGFAPLISYDDEPLDDEAQPGIYMGFGLPAINFCPWCGTMITEGDHL